jgi:hypothetical protein
MWHNGELCSFCSSQNIVRMAKRKKIVMGSFCFGPHGKGNSEGIISLGRRKHKFFFKSQFILQSVVIHLAECYGEGVLQCLGKKPSVGPLRR